MQGLLGLSSKKDPLIELISSTNDKKMLDVYLGFFSCLQIPNDSTSVQYRLLVGKFAHAGLSIAHLMTAFGFSRPTIMRYRDLVATYGHNDNELFARLRGLNCEKTKLTTEVTAYIESRFRLIYPENRATYNSQLRDEVAKIFDIKISPEALRRVIAPIRHKLDNQPEAPKEPSSAIDEASAVANNDFAVPSNDSTSEIVVAEMAAEDPTNGQIHLHAGLLLLNLWICTFIAGLDQWRTNFLLWFYQIFAGSVNLEQARYIVHKELSRFIGHTATSVMKSRYFLSELARHFFSECTQLLFKANFNGLYQYFKQHSYYFYFDGHFDPYYGQTEILPGWSCLFNRAMKGTHHYVIHDAYGFPLIKELKDNFYDFRVYLKHAIEKIRSFMLGVSFGIIFDRGGFSEDVLKYFTAEGVYYITWEKYFDIQKEYNLQFDSLVIIEREINEVGNYKTITYQCAETTYHLGENVRCRKLVIRTEQEEKNGEKRDFYASILTNDPSLSHQTIVERMTSRWANQENDFRYEKRHFGLDQITSYDVIGVVSIQDQIDQQKGHLKALETEQSDTQQKQKQIYSRLGVKRLTQKLAKKIEENAKTDPERYQNMISLRALQNQSKSLQSQISQLRKKIKRLEKIEKKGYMRLDYRKKHIYDQIRLMARNIFYCAISEFKLFYPNLRDLHVVFWKLVRSPGFIEYEKEQIHVTLYCPFFKGRALDAVEKFIELLNEKNVTFLDGSNRNIVFHVKTEVANSFSVVEV